MNNQQYHLECIDNVTFILPLEMLLRIPTLQIFARFPPTDPTIQPVSGQSSTELNISNLQNNPAQPIVHIQVPILGRILNGILIHLKQSILYEAAEIQEYQTPVFAIDDESMVELIDATIYLGL